MSLQFPSIQCVREPTDRAALLDRVILMSATVE